MSLSDSRALARTSHKRPSSLDSTLIRITMVPFAPIRPSPWLIRPKVWTIAGTERLRTIPTSFRSTLTCRTQALADWATAAPSQLRSPKVRARPRPLYRCDRTMSGHHLRGRTARRYDVCPSPWLPPLPRCDSSRCRKIVYTVYIYVVDVVRMYAYIRIRYTLYFGP